MQRFDVIVIGAGSMGASTCWDLANRGVKVLGIDQFHPPHEHGSHTGQSRIIRKAYFEHPDYVPLLERSYENWKKFEVETGATFYFETGIVYFGKPSHPTMQGVRKSAELYDLKADEINKKDSVKEFPAFRIPGDFQTLFEPEAGFVTPETSIRHYLQFAEKLGAKFKFGERVLSWKREGDGVKVTTDRETYFAEKLIITTGSWSSSLIPQLKSSLKVTRQTLAWISPKNPDLFSLGNFPCWFIEDEELGMFYGFPVLPFEKFGGPIGLKLASHRPGETVDPDHVERKTLRSEEESIRKILSKYLPEAGDEIITLKTCLYTYSPDENFIIDFLPGTNNRVIIACGFSGHGFKFVPVIGEILADLSVKGKTDLPIGFLSQSRL